MEQASILVVEDQSEIRQSLIAYLCRYGFQAEGAEDAQAARTQLNAKTFDLILLDVMLPREDGYSLCRSLQGKGNQSPLIIFLTALDELADRVAGLELGADDYVTKPFEPRELVARIRAVLRRKAPASLGGVDAKMPQSPAAKTDPQYVFGPWTLDISRRELLRNGEPVMLTPTEFVLLRAFVEHPKVVLSRDRLAILTQRGRSPGFDRSIDSRVTRLRRKLEDNARESRLIRTAWGDGYLFVADVQQGFAQEP